MNLSQPDSRACAFNHQVISPPTFQWLATWLLWSSGRQRGLLIVLEHWTAPLIFFRVELLMKEKGGEGATGSHCPFGHQEDCSSSGYARVNHRNGFGGREPDFQSGVLPEDWWVHLKACASPSKNPTRDLASVNSWLCLFKRGDFSNSKHLWFYNPGPSLDPLLVFMKAGVVEGRGSYKRVGSTWAPQGKGDGQKMGRWLRKAVWFFGQWVLLTCSNGPFPVLFLPSPIPQTGSGKFPVFWPSPFSCGGR